MALLVLIPLLGFILFWHRLLDSRSSSAALHAASAILLALYVTALLDVVRWATAVLLIAGSVIAVYEISVLARSKKPFPLPVGVLLILCGLFWLLHRNGAYASYDEYAHWGIYLKEMLATHRLWDADTNAMHLRYLPGPPLWQYFFLAFTRATEGGAFLAQFSLLFVPLLVLWQGIERQQFLWLLAVFALLLLALANFGHGFASLYVDHLLATWFAGILFSFMLDLRDRSPAQLVIYVLPLTTLVLLKDSGLFFAAAAAGIMVLLVFGRAILAPGDRRMGNSLAKAAALGIVWIAGALLVTVSWNANRNAMGMPVATVSIGGIVGGIVSGESNLDAGEQAELRSRFRRVVMQQQISKDETSAMYNAFSYSVMPQFTDRFRLTTASMLMLFVAWQIIVLRWLVRPGDRLMWAIGGGGLFLTAIVYLAVLFLSYRFAFGDRALSLSSYLRYAHTALLPMLLFVFLPLMPGFDRSGDNRIEFPGGWGGSRAATMFAVLLGVLYIFETPHLTPVYKPSEAPPIRQQLAPMTEKVAGLVGDARLWVYFPVPDSNGLIGRILQYQMTPVHTKVEADLSFLLQHPDEVLQAAADSDYLWFPVEHPQFDQALRGIFGEDLKDRVFRVDRLEDKVTIIALDGIFD
jgi:hypothetical protein